MRGFEKISYKQFKKDFKNMKDILKKYKSLKKPVRATKCSAGYDFFAPFDIVLNPGESIKIPTGIKAYFGPDEMLMLLNKSSIGFKYNIRLLNQVGIIESDYYNNIDNEGHMWVAIKNEGEKVFKVNQGEKYFQGIFVKFLICDDDNEERERKGGIGSTGKE